MPIPSLSWLSHNSHFEGNLMTFFGVCYSPYHRTSDLPPNGVTEAGVDADMEIITASGFSHIRTYGVDGGNQWNVDKATKHGLKLAVGVWADPKDAGKTNAQIDLALGQAQTAALKYGKILELDLVIGNEVDRTDVARYSPEQIHNAMTYANKKTWVREHKTKDNDLFQWDGTGEQT